MEKARKDAEDNIANKVPIEPPALAITSNGSSSSLTEEKNDETLDASNAKQGDVDFEREDLGDQTILAQTEVSQIFGKGASSLSFNPVQSSTPTRDEGSILEIARDESKRNVSVGSEDCLEPINDSSSKKLRLDVSPSDCDFPTDDVELNPDKSGEDSAGDSEPPKVLSPKDSPSSSLLSQKDIDPPVERKHTEEGIGTIGRVLEDTNKVNHDISTRSEEDTEEGEIPSDQSS